VAKKWPKIYKNSQKSVQMGTFLRRPTSAVIIRLLVKDPISISALYIKYVFLMTVIVKVILVNN
jgi:hypothetical protein